MPNGDDGGRTNDEGRRAFARVEREQAEHLESFPEAHFVGDERMGSAVEHLAHPSHAADLVGTQEFRHARRRFRFREKLFPPRQQFLVRAQFQRVFVAEKGKQGVNRHAVCGGIRPVADEFLCAPTDAYDAASGQKDRFVRVAHDDAGLFRRETFAVDFEVPKKRKGVGGFGAEDGFGLEFPRFAAEGFD